VAVSSGTGHELRGALGGFAGLQDVSAQDELPHVPAFVVEVPLLDGDLTV
jgi:hypothetical protein